MKDLVIPSGVTEIASCAYENVYSIQKVILPDTIAIIGEDAFANSGLTQINLPIGLVEIGPGAFKKCLFLTEINIPAGIFSIPINAFYCCKNLERVKLPDSNTLSIKERAFYGCASLRDIVIPPYTMEIQNVAFEGCCNLKEIKCEMQDLDAVVVDEWAFMDKQYNETLLVVPEGTLQKYQVHPVFGRFRNIKEQKSTFKSICFSHEKQM